MHPARWTSMFAQRTAWHRYARCCSKCAFINPGSATFHFSFGRYACQLAGGSSSTPEAHFAACFAFENTRVYHILSEMLCKRRSGSPRSERIEIERRHLGKHQLSGPRPLLPWQGNFPQRRSSNRLACPASTQAVILLPRLEASHPWPFSSGSSRHAGGALSQPPKQATNAVSKLLLHLRLG